MEKIRLFVDNLFYGLPHDRRTSQLKEDLLAELERRYQEIAARCRMKTRPLAFW